MTRQIFKLFGLGITTFSNLNHLREKALKNSSLDSDFLIAVGNFHQSLTPSLLNQSKAQLRQDLFVLSETNYKREGYFVEFGATNGIGLSNTYLLEKEFSWSGILAEPAKVWRNSLLKNRPNASIETLCLWKDSESRLTFNETDVPELSTLDIFSHGDLHTQNREVGHKYSVQTISLNDLLKKHRAPKQIDYLSIDTEGSEYEILSAFDFTQYNIQIITVEHNYTLQREKIFKLLSSQGYERKFEDISHFDDWYIKK